MNVADHVLTAVERTLLKTPALYRYTEVIPRTFLATAGIRKWSQEDVFSKEPVMDTCKDDTCNEYKSSVLGYKQNNTVPFSKI